MGLVEIKQRLHLPDLTHRLSRTMAKIVVIGAGVSGLTTALLLSRRHNVTVIAKHMPGDYDFEYASPWAGETQVSFQELNDFSTVWFR